MNLPPTVSRLEQGARILRSAQVAPLGKPTMGNRPQQAGSLKGPVVYLFHPLKAEPVVPCVPGVEVQGMALEHLGKWLELFRAALGCLDPPVRPWGAEDFHRLVASRPWWSPRQTLLAWRDGELVGSAIWGRHPAAGRPCGAVHWLMVHPRFQRQGLGRLLLRRLEHQAWQQGIGCMRVQTHRRWQAAVAFYLRMGYKPG